MTNPVETLARVALSPLLAAQAIWVISRALRLPEAAGPRAGTAGNGPLLRLRIIGDSSAAGVGVARQEDALAGKLATALGADFTVDWHLNARTGATSRSTLAALQDQPPGPADVVILVLGVNDTTRLTPLRLWRRRQNALLKRVRTLHAPRLIYVTGVPPLEHFPLLPQPLRWTLGRHGRALEKARSADLVAQQDVIPVPFDLDPQPEFMAEDGFHPSATLYRLWATKMASRICTDWPQTHPA